MRGVVNVLIADDEPLFRNWIRANLAELNCHTIESASNGKEAVSIFRKRRPEIIFMDIDMPILNGLEAMKQIITIDTNAYVVIVSGCSTFDNVKIALDSGAKGFIVKPYTIKKVTEIINKYKKNRK